MEAFLHSQQNAAQAFIIYGISNKSIKECAPSINKIPS